MVRALALLVALTAIVGCMRDYPAPVIERSILIAKRQPLEKPDSYLVQGGDTLYSLAFRYGMDVERLADINGIDAPYQIYPGQRLRFEATDEVTVSAISSSEPDAGGITTEPLPAPEPPATEPAPERQPEPETPAPEPELPEPVAAPVEEPAPSPPPELTIPAGEPDWRWPVKGALLNTFQAGDPARNGIDIAGEPGEPVAAAAAGKVVYSGNGLVGYGELIIIKHNDRFLSAYGHNRKRLVEEGDVVTAGEQIAELGSSGAPQPMLHFEIRVKGDPVNPLEYLP